MSQETFKELAVFYTKLSTQVEATKTRVIFEHFGCSPRIMSIAWKIMEKKEKLPCNAKPIHLVWSLHYLKMQPYLRSAANFFDIDKDTYIKWRDFFIKKLS